MQPPQQPPGGPPPQQPSNGPPPQQPPGKPPQRPPSRPRRLAVDERVAVEITRAIRDGDVDTLTSLLEGDPSLAAARIVSRDGERTLLHVATDYPGHCPNVGQTIERLVRCGADIDAPFVGRHAETSLHWAASANDIAAIDALLAAGATLDARGGIIGNGTPLDDAVAFGQWDAAQHLFEHGARTRLATEAALGLVDDVRARLAAIGGPEPLACDVTHAFWYACHGGQHATAALLAAAGAEIDWIGYDELSPLDVAIRTCQDRTANTSATATATATANANDVVEWLRSIGARTADEIRKRSR